MFYFEVWKDGKDKRLKDFAENGWCVYALSCVATSVLRMRLLHVVAFSKKLRWLAQTKVFFSKTQVHAVNALWKRLSQLSFRKKVLHFEREYLRDNTHTHTYTHNIHTHVWRVMFERKNKSDNKMKIIGEGPKKTRWIPNFFHSFWK